ncbi:hypothetical protein B0H66DRAFT_401159 [Apodospora peruviana]|uniref:NmrA-like domain-containing protein n=1 Tax=Apodospora peruviana TaxID=516989 RepID=A0AAE0LYP8_9PEZI|nr:hypothetical protein B0H66DRAFT_401159 [Apodospora peruviana]
MSPKIVTVVGATGAQGKGVIAAFANNAAYHVRALTRNPSSPSGKALTSQGLEVVQADVNDLDSLKAAFAGSHIIYGVTNFFEPFASLNSPEKAMEVEVQQGINLALAAASTPTLEHYIWSTLPDAKAVSGGKYLVPHFEGKIRIDNYIRNEQPALLAKTSFFWVTFYHSNLQFPMFTPYWIPTAQKYVQFANYAADTPITTIGDVSVNISPFVKAVVEQPEKTKNGNVVLASLEDHGAEEMLQIWAGAKGTKAQFVRVSGEAFREIWPLWGEEMGVMMEFWDEYKEKSWAVTVPGQKLVTAEGLGITRNMLQGLEEAYQGFEL